MYVLIKVFFVLLFINCLGQDNPIIEKNISIGTHELHYYSSGHGSPTIVLDVGIGGSFYEWLPVFEKVNDEVGIFCYDRAGYGQSENGPFPRNCDRAANELKTLLDKANIKGPYLLIGHSLGASNLQVFTNKNIEKIAGMILLDPPPLDWISGNGFPKLTAMAESQTNEFEKIAESTKNSEIEEEKKKADFFSTVASEHREMFSSGAKQLAAIESFGDISLIVIASGKPNHAFGEDAESFQKFWNEECKIISQKSSKGKYILASESGHHIQKDDPGIIISAIGEMLLECE